jgi:hypothetical protein
LERRPPPPPPYFEGFVRTASKQKWLQAHGIERWARINTDYARRPQKRFFEHFFEGENNGWDRQLRGQLQVRPVDKFAAQKVFNYHNGRHPQRRLTTSIPVHGYF